MFVSEREDIKEGWRKLRNEELHSLRFSPYIMAGIPNLFLNGDTLDKTSAIP
jgi:hypothetical protein